MVADGAVISLESEVTIAFLAGNYRVVEDALRKMPEDKRRKFIARLWDPGSGYYACASGYRRAFKEENKPEEIPH